MCIILRVQLKWWLRMASTVFEPRRPVAFSFSGLSTFYFGGKVSGQLKAACCFGFAEFTSTHNNNFVLVVKNWVDENWIFFKAVGILKIIISKWHSLFLKSKLLCTTIVLYYTYCKISCSTELKSTQFSELWIVLYEI